MLTGIGKVNNAAVGAVSLIDTFRPDVIVNTGIAGSFQPRRRSARWSQTPWDIRDVYCGIRATPAARCRAIP